VDGDERTTQNNLLLKIEPRARGTHSFGINSYFAAWNAINSHGQFKGHGTATLMLKREVVSKPDYCRPWPSPNRNRFMHSWGVSSHSKEGCCCGGLAASPSDFGLPSVGGSWLGSLACTTGTMCTICRDEEQAHTWKNAGDCWNSCLKTQGAC